MFRKSYGRNSRYSGRGGNYKNRRYNTSSNSGFRSGNRKQRLDMSLLVKKAAENQPEQTYNVKNTFTDFPINEILKKNILNHGYVTLTPIQDQAIPHLLEGKDVVGIANTGTGKTAAFLIPLINKVFSNRDQRVLIIAPTRELALQIDGECKIFSKGLNIYSILCIGGTNISRQVQGLRRNPQIVIGTPGRLKDLKNRNALNFALYNSIVLDEVDRMLDMGFINDVRYIISFLPQNRQSLFFSATLPGTVQDVMKTFLRNPVMISVKSQQTMNNIEQDIVRTNGRTKIEILHDLLIKKGYDKVLVFGRTKWGIEKLAEQLIDRGFAVTSLHGNKNQSQRRKALDQFKENKVNIMLATDVASRGLDIDNITHVINYDLPETYDDYLHRIGRTGRANKKGVALSFVD